MIRDITLGQYFPGSSPVHRLDPRTKILLVLGFIIGIFMIQNYTGYLLAAVFVFFVIRISGIPFKFVFRGMKPLLFLVIFTTLINIFLTEGDPIFTWWILKPTWQGLSLAIQMIIRLFLLIAGTSLLTLTTSPISLTDGIEHLLGPFRKIGVPAHELAMMMSIALRFIPTLLEETDKIMKAQTARGADFESGGIISRAKSLIPLLVPLFISAFRRADELAVAMEARCYRGGKGRTRLRELRFAPRDAYAALIVVAVFALVLVLGRSPYLI